MINIYVDYSYIQTNIHNLPVYSDHITGGSTLRHFKVQYTIDIMYYSYVYSKHISGSSWGLEPATFYINVYNLPVYSDHISGGSTLRHFKVYYTIYIYICIIHRNLNSNWRDHGV